MASYTGLHEFIEAAILATWPEAHANGIYYTTDAPSLRRKADAGELPFVLLRGANFDQDNRWGTEAETGNVEFAYIRRRDPDALALIAKLQALQEYLVGKSGSWGTGQTRPTIRFDHQRPLNLWFRDTEQEFEAGEVIWPVTI